MWLHHDLHCRAANGRRIMKGGCTLDPVGLGRQSKCNCNHIWGEDDKLIKQKEYVSFFEMACLVFWLVITDHSLLPRLIQSLFRHGPRPFYRV